MSVPHWGLSLHGPYHVWLSADPDVVSLEAADRPNFFLHVTANGSLELAKWQGSDAFRHHASFLLHQGTWRAGLVALESLAEPGSFLFVSGPTVALRPYEHSEAFRRGTLFRLLGRCPPCPHPPPLSPSLSCPPRPLLIPLPSAPQETESPLTLLAPGGHVGATLRWEVSWPPCWWPKECGQRGSGPSQLPGSCLLPQARSMV